MSAERQPASLRVFISYSRQDMAFVDRLQAALSERGIEAFVDRDDIEKGEAWWTRITQLISEAETIVFVLSPGSVDSKVCADEVAFAERLNKRFVPIVARDLDGRNVPKALARLNYVWFISNPMAEASGDFGEALDELIRAIETDIAWIREHTRLGTLAARWEARKRSTELLLRGAELATAESWLTTRPEKAPNPTDAHRALITLSRQGAMRRQRIVVGASLAAIVVAGVLTSVALWQRSLAVAEGERALRNARTAEAITREAQITQSGLLSESVRELLKLPGDSEAPLAMLLALEGMPDAQSDDGRQVGRPNVAEAQFQLNQAYFSNRERAVISYDSGVRTLAWSPDGSRLATGSGWVNEKIKTARIVNVTTGAELVRVPHEGIVWAVAWSPDGKRLATGSDDKTARIFDAATGNELARVAHESVVWALAWSPDGTRLASSSATIGQSIGLTRIVDALSGKELAQVTYRHAPDLDWRAPKVIWSTDGKRIAIGSTDNTIHIIDAAAGNELARIKQEGHVGALSWSPDGTRLATGSTDNTARIIDVASGRELVRVNHAGAVYAVSWSPDGTKLATGSSDKTARLLDAATGNELVRVVHNDSVLAVAWTPDGTRLATGSLDKSARIISAATGVELARVTHNQKVELVAWNFDGTQLASSSLGDPTRVTIVGTDKEAARVNHGDEVRAVAWSPDGKRVATGSDDNTARIIEAATGSELGRLRHDSRVRALSWSPDGTRLATGSTDNTARIIDVASGRELVRVNHAGAVYAVSWSPDGTKLATGSSDKTARLLDAATGNELVRVVHNDSVLAVAWTPDGTRLATGSLDNSARIISAETGMELARLTCKNMLGTASQNSDGTLTVDKCLPDAVVLTVAWSPDGRRLAVGSRERMGSRGNAFIFDATSGDLLARVTHSGAVEAMSWNPDGRRLATGSRDSTARIIDAATGNELGRITHAGSVTATAWNQDGTLLATGSTDKVARIIAASSVKELARVTHEAPVAAVAWSPDGRGLATGSTDKSMRLWRVFPTSQALVDAAKSRATRCLTQTQRAQYFLPAAPPDWCVERRLWPYHGDDWKGWLPKQKTWLANGRQGDPPPLPKPK